MQTSNKNMEKNEDFHTSVKKSSSAEVSVHVPQPSDPQSVISQFETYLQIVSLLRKHCPWDKEQTHETLAPLLIEEAYETTDAIFKSNSLAVSEELGDVLLHIVMHSLIAEESNTFTLKDVIQGSAIKMVKRHPHVFSDNLMGSIAKPHNSEEGCAISSDEILKMWEHIKTKENKKSVLDGVPSSLPSLVKADRIQQKASNIGFDWENVSGAWDKVFEEIEEFKAEIESGDKEQLEEEFGDILFSLVNVARFVGVIAENALQKTNNKFIKRFQFVEEYAKKNGKNLSQMSLEEMDAIWNKAKQNTKSVNG